MKKKLEALFVPLTELYLTEALGPLAPFTKSSVRNSEGTWTL